MNATRRAATATKLMSASFAVVSVCRFGRNIILARMLTPADFGVGATLALSLMLLEMMTELGPAKQLVQARKGMKASWQGAAHVILVVRGLLVALILFSVAGLIAEWLEVPEAAFAFQCIALAPLMRGFEHMDVARFQRDLRMGRLALVEGAPVLASLVAAPIAGLALGDYRAFVVVSLIAAGGRTLVSHLVATRPYRLQTREEILWAFVSFGWPLIGNSLILFLVLHGERLLVASYFDLATLGAYSVALSLAFTPSSTLARLHGSVALPLLSKARDDKPALRRTMASSAQIMCLIASWIAVVFIIAGSWLVGLVYGDEYLLAQQVVPWIGLMCAMRLTRCTPAMTAIALGDTKIPLQSNLARAASFGAAAWLLARGADVVWAPACGFLGELAGYGISLWLLHRRHAAPVDECLKCLAGAAVVTSAAVVISRQIVVGSHYAEPITALASVLVLAGFALVCWNDLRGICWTLLSRQREGLSKPRAGGG